MLDFSSGGNVRNRFNLLSSKEWLPFQKSWFIYSSDEEMLRSNVRFFTKSDEGISNVYVSGFSKSIAEEILVNENLNAVNITSKKIAYAYLDLRKDLKQITNKDDYDIFIEDLVKKVEKIFDSLEERRFISIIASNLIVDGNYIPYAWDIGKIVGSIFSLKDEKIACIENKKQRNEDNRRQGEEVFYSLYFRKDELSKRFENWPREQSKIRWDNAYEKMRRTPSWFILKPPPRRKDEILHPAKYPEELVDIYVKAFTSENENVYDPMCGTGSTQIGAMRNLRNGYGMELSPFFTEIANSRCDELRNPSQGTLFETQIQSSSKIINDDSRNFMKYDFPKMHYLLTSPPYWDMLNMKGAENQARRIEKGLQTNYSENQHDLGNISDYNDFIQKLCDIYFEHTEILIDGHYMTIIVKNIKKKGSNYPFAWDLAFKLQDKFILLSENFWLQDDISIAPFGYGYTWVSNTFHQYCLNFKLRDS